MAHFISLFSGAGGMDLGFVNNGFAPAVAIDNSAAAIESYKANLPSCKTLHRSILGLPATDILAQLPSYIEREHPPLGVVGGPPCQGFSYGNVTLTEDDPRNQLPFEYARLLRELTAAVPIRFFLMENVLGLRQTRHRDLLSKLTGEFQSAGFNLLELTVEGGKLGMAQTRKRMILLGLDEGLWRSTKEGTTIVRQVARMSNKSPLPLSSVIGGMPDPAYYSKGLSPDAIPLHPNHWTMQPKSHRFADGDFSGCTRSFRCLEWNQPSPTVAYGNREIHVHPSRVRRLSVLEAMLIQGFPSSFRFQGSFSDQVRQVCNAVPPLMVSPIAHALRLALEKTAIPSSHQNSFRTREPTTAAAVTEHIYRELQC